MREEILVGFYAWAGEAAALIEEANSPKRSTSTPTTRRDSPTSSGRSSVTTSRPTDL
jgi:hypothetical protein